MSVTFASKHRPRRFSEVSGQDAEVRVLKTIVENDWNPPAILLQGPYGTGKTSLARLLARAKLCEDRQGVEPCGTCPSCGAMDADNNLAYTEIDAASQGLVADVRQMKDYVSFRLPGTKLKILTYDESHMLTQQAQNTLLQTLEEGAHDLIFVFATTDSDKMLPTIRSRCIDLRMKLLTATQIADRLRQVCELENVSHDDKALRVIATYAKGHLRDALILLEQLARTSPTGLTEELARTYLRLDRHQQVYELLVEADQAKALNLLEELLCSHAVSELLDRAAEILLNAHKHRAGAGDFTQADAAWLKRVSERHGDTLLDKAEQLLLADQDIGTIQYGMIVLAKVLSGGATAPAVGGSDPSAPLPAAPSHLRKPGK